MSTVASTTESQAQATTSTIGTDLSSLQPSSASPISSADNSSTPFPASSSPSPTTANNATTSTTPATSATPTTTPQSTPAQTSSAAAATTSSSLTSSPSTTSATVQITTTPSTFTTQVATTLPSTDAAGSIVYVTSTVPDVITTSISTSTGGTTSTTSSSHTGVIVGAVVGGVAGIILFAILLFCIRKRVRKDEFDGNFDPDRIVGHTDDGGGTLPHVDLADEVTPFPQPYTDQGSSSMRQYGETPYAAIPPSLSGSGKASTDFYPPSVGAPIAAQPRPFIQPGAGPSPSGAYLPPINMYGTGPVDWHTPRPGVSPPPSTVSHNTTSTRATKEREALGRQGLGLGLATQQEVAEGSRDVVVHQDAGRAPVEEHAQPREIPPAYESIRQD